MRDLKDVYKRIATRNAEGRRNKIVKIRRKDGQRGESKLRNMIIYLAKYRAPDHRYEKDLEDTIAIINLARDRVLRLECGATLTVEEEVIKALDKGGA